MNDSKSAISLKDEGVFVGGNQLRCHIDDGFRKISPKQFLFGLVNCLLNDCWKVRTA